MDDEKLVALSTRITEPLKKRMDAYVKRSGMKTWTFVEIAIREKLDREEGEQREDS